MATKIQWTDETDNPIHVKGGGHWCHKISEGCRNCYAEAINQSGFFEFASHLEYSGDVPELEFDQKMVEGWKRKKNPKRRFVCSMTDLFGEWVPLDWQFKILNEALLAPSQTIQLLTKRPRIASEVADKWCDVTRRDSLPDNVWVGVSIENQRTANDRLPKLLQIPANRFLSVEPMLGSITINQRILEAIHWVICGGESGSKARPFYLEEAADLAEQCKAAFVHFFFKQMGSNPFYEGKPFHATGKGDNLDELPDELKALLTREFPA